jgi:hypothetical protein
VGTIEQVDTAEQVVTAAVIEDVRDEDVSELDDEITAVGPLPVKPAPTVPSPPPDLATEQSRARPRGQGARKRAAAAASGPAAEKEKLAADNEAAKTLARSSSRNARKRSGAKGDTTSKKK